MALSKKQKAAKQRGLFAFKMNSTQSYYKAELLKKPKPHNQSQLSANDDTESKMELQDEVFKLQQGQVDIVKQIGKMVRQIN
mmetsp:Transcript_39973/g.61173  ORF Transcript_39973/g.61173 Transcript_39973/m.61173 type:complete len:82 (+) Transcript_39973:649-894(+)